MTRVARRTRRAGGPEPLPAGAAPGDAASSAPSTKAAAPAPVVNSPAVPTPGTKASDATTSARRAWPAARASQAAVRASIPAWGDPLHRRAVASGNRPSAVDRNAWLGPSAKGGLVVPHHSPER